jgi:predicted RNase H-like HicB family nuclease
MTYRVELIHSDDGYVVACPDLPGCASQGETEEEAIRNIKSAITEYLSVADEHHAQDVPHREVRYVDVPATATNTAPLEPFKVTPISMGLPPFTKVQDLLDELEGQWRR